MFKTIIFWFSLSLLTPPLILYLKFQENEVYHVHSRCPRCSLLGHYGGSKYLARILLKEKYSGNRLTRPFLAPRCRFSLLEIDSSQVSRPRLLPSNRQRLLPSNRPRLLPSNQQRHLQSSRPSHQLPPSHAAASFLQRILKTDPTVVSKLVTTRSGKWCNGFHHQDVILQLYSNSNDEGQSLIPVFHTFLLGISSTIWEGESTIQNISNYINKCFMKGIFAAFWLSSSRFM